MGLDVFWNGSMATIRLSGGMTMIMVSGIPSTNSCHLLCGGSLLDCVARHRRYRFASIRTFKAAARCRCLCYPRRAPHCGPMTNHIRLMTQIMRACSISANGAGVVTLCIKAVDAAPTQKPKKKNQRLRWLLLFATDVAVVDTVTVVCCCCYLP
jgi:hypothetical protein